MHEIQSFNVTLKNASLLAFQPNKKKYKKNIKKNVKKYTSIEANNNNIKKEIKFNLSEKC